MKLICIICLYFGELPNYFDRWTTSAGFNFTIDWLLIGDRLPQNLPTNIKKIEMTFADMQTRVQRCFDFPITLDKPYNFAILNRLTGLYFMMR